MGVGGHGGPLSGPGGQGVGGLGGNGGAGGGIRSTGGTLVVVNTSVTENIAENGGTGGSGVGGDAGLAASTSPGGNAGVANGGQGGEGGRGGGIHASGTAIIRESTIAANRVGLRGHWRFRLRWRTAAMAELSSGAATAATPAAARAGLAVQAAGSSARRR